MTTIAYRNGVLAADRRVSAGDIIGAQTAMKVWQKDPQTAIAMTGDLAEAYALVDWLLAHPIDEFDPTSTFTISSRPKAGEHVTVVIARSNPNALDGVRLFVIEGSGWYEAMLEETGFAAWGSGRGYALAAMHMKASAEEAVSIAAKIDPYTGGAIRAARIKIDKS